MLGEDLLLEIISRAKPVDDDGTLQFSAEDARALEIRLIDILEGPAQPEAVEAYIRAVAAFQIGEQPLAARQLLEIGATVVEVMQAKNRPTTDKVRSSVTGAEDLTRVRPISSQPAPKGAIKASTLIQALQKQHR